jgi:large subunit ribosomal protein L15
LIGSGLEVVAAQALYGIVGAISLERGGEAANRMVRETIMIPLGLSWS